MPRRNLPTPTSLLSRYAAARKAGQAQGASGGKAARTATEKRGPGRPPKDPDSFRALLSLEEVRSRFPMLTPEEARKVHSAVVAWEGKKGTPPPGKDGAVRYPVEGVGGKQRRHALTVKVPTAYDLALLAVASERTGLPKGALVLEAVRRLLEATPSRR